MNSMSLTGTNGTVTIDAAGVTIQHSIYGRTKTIPWAQVGGATVRPGTWLARPQFLVMTKLELAAIQSGSQFWESVAGKQAADWFIALAKETVPQWEALKSEINKQVAQGIMNGMAAEAAWKPGEDVLVRWPDGQRYAGRLFAVEAAQLLVVFPNGTQQWVPREHVQRP